MEANHALSQAQMEQKLIDLLSSLKGKAYDHDKDFTVVEKEDFDEYFDKNCNQVNCFQKITEIDFKKTVTEEQTEKTYDLVKQFTNSEGCLHYYGQGLFSKEEIELLSYFGLGAVDVTDCLG